MGILKGEDWTFRFSIAALASLANKYNGGMYYGIRFVVEMHAFWAVHLIIIGGWHYPRGKISRRLKSFRDAQILPYWLEHLEILLPRAALVKS